MMQKSFSTIESLWNVASGGLGRLKSDPYEVSTLPQSYNVNQVSGFGYLVIQPAVGCGL